MKKLVIIGAGGFGREVFWLVQRINANSPTWDLLGFLDDNLDKLNMFDGYGRIIGDIASYERLNRPYAICAIGSPVVRKAIVERLSKFEPLWATLIDPSVSVGPGSTVGNGCVFLKNANLTANVTVGNHVHFGCTAQAAHDAKIGDYCTLCGHVDVNGAVCIEEGVFVGSHACILPRVHVEPWSTVGAGTVAIRTVHTKTSVFGVPAKEITRPRNPSPHRVYLSPPHMSDHERELLLEAFDSNWIAPLGPHVNAFETEFAEKVGVRNAVALSSGTAALHLSLLMMGVGPGDEVLTSTLTFSATANAITYLGATPVFIDSNRETWNMDPDLLAEELAACKKRGKMPKAVVPVDLYGQCADYDRILPVCREYGVPVIEDAAEALGATYRNKPAGNFGALACFSFNGNKIITTSGGGMLVSENKEWIDRARFLSTQARDPAPHYQHSHIGYNYRMSNLLAAVGRGQLRVLDDRVEQRRANNHFYRQALGNLPGINFMPEFPAGRPTCWLTCITVDPAAFGMDRESIRLALENENIEARPVWKPMHLQPVFANCRVRGGAVAADLFDRGLCLPSGSSLSAEDRMRVVNTITRR